MAISCSRASSSDSMEDLFEIIVGSYEQFLIGYKVRNIVNEYKMERSFATHSHLASVRCVANEKHYLASGGADDGIYLYDMRYRREQARLLHHSDTVNCVAFTPEASHMFSCSNDGTITAVRCGNWMVEKTWKPHKGLAVNTLAIHPTGKLALSAGADGILRTWNLIKGRQAYATNLVPRLKQDAKYISVLKWSPNGEKYLLAANQRVDLYSVVMAGVDSEIKFDSKVSCVEFLSDDLIAVGLENGQIKIYDLKESEESYTTVAHDVRVKCMALNDDLLVTASSSGEIKLWRCDTNSLDLLQGVNCGVRITCISLVKPCQIIESEVKSEETQEAVKEKKKFRLRSEVIIEGGDDWEVTPTETPKVLKKKLKKKRSIETAVQSADLPVKKKKSISNKRKSEKISETSSATDEHSAKKKKKLKVVDNEIRRSFTKKRKQEEISLVEENESLPTKKLKKSTKIQNNNKLKKSENKVVLKEKNNVSPRMKIHNRTTIARKTLKKKKKNPGKKRE